MALFAKLPPTDSATLAPVSPATRASTAKTVTTAFLTRPISTNSTQQIKP